MSRINIAPDDPRFEPYYALAAKYQLPFILSTCDILYPKGRLRFAQPLLVDEVAVSHPAVQFVILHFGIPWHVDAAEVILKKDNVWTELSGFLSVDAELENLLKAGPLPGASSP